MSINKLLVIDKDGTLVKSVSGSEFVQHPEDQELLPGVKESIARYTSEGWQIVVASNQGGVAAGYKSLEDAIDEMNECLHLLKGTLGLERLGVIKGGIICPDNGRTAYYCKVAKNSNYPVVHIHEEYPELIGQFRKPNPGMLLAAMQWLECPFKSVLMVGDRSEDEGAAKAAGVSFQWANEWRGVIDG